RRRQDDVQIDKNLYTTGSLPIYPQDYRKVSAVPLAPGKEEIPGLAKLKTTPPAKPDVVREHPSPLQEPISQPENQPEIKTETQTEIQPEIQPEVQSAVQSAVQPKAEQVEKEEQLELFDNRLLSKDARIAHKIVGQLFDTYWLVQYEDSLYIIDQHAAHEKVLYERMMNDYKNKEITAQYMSPPLIVTLQNQEAELLQKYQELFENFGFEIEPFGGKEYQISAVPSNLYGVASSELFIEILDHLEDTGTKTLDMITEKLASMSCKAAVKGNHRLSGVEVEALIDELLTLENPYNCPHGRPTIISMSRYELEKKFKRIV
ncbi:MAG TPA: DNA mismatch repair protein MutL, partial [Candidatus Pelethocola excrementipullorum]|nr:DNA mismatch repair protein MutL [Candidatus Pelethocola excrementipullorum]